MFKIGKLKLKSRVLLAPMLEPNDVAFRILCKRAGAGLTWTGMISPLSKRKLDLVDVPAIQLFGNSEKGIRDFIKKYDSQVALWDFNLGCPSKFSKRLEHGAFMHNDLEMIEKILKTMRGATDNPVTVKLRKSDNAIRIAKLVEPYVDAIAIHARTVSQGYSGDVDYDFALELKKSVSVPVIYSGNVDEKNVDAILKDFDFVMIGRAAIGKPSVFGREKVEFSDYLKLALEYMLPFRQIKFQAMNWTCGISGARETRTKLVGAKSVEDIEKIMTKNK